MESNSGTVATLIIREAQRSMDLAFMKMCCEIEEMEKQNQRIIPVENKVNRLNSNRAKKMRCVKAKGSNNERRCRMIERRRM